MIAYKSNNGFIYIGQNNINKANADKIILNLKLVDLCMLLKSSSDWSAKIDSESDFVFAPVENNEKLKKLFDELDSIYNRDTLAATQVISENSLNVLDDVKNKLKREATRLVARQNTQNGTSKLVYTPSHGIIKIAKRTSKPKDKYTSEYSICISNDIREEFFHDVRISSGFAKNHKWEISDALDTDLYSKWKTIIFRLQSMEV